MTAGALPPGSRKVSYLRLRMPVGLWVVRLGGCDLGRGAAAGVARLAWRVWWAVAAHSPPSGSRWWRYRSATRKARSRDWLRLRRGSHVVS